MYVLDDGACDFGIVESVCKHRDLVEVQSW